jgi:nucleotide-binding universal stress UspA family protein
VFRSILVAVDGSPAAAEALEQAVDVARAHGARLTLLTVASPPRWRPAGPLVPPYPTDAELEEEARAIVERAEERVPDDVPHATVVRTGPAAREILERVACAGHDLVVLGSRGHGAAASLVLGSVSRAVAAHCPVPVLIARSHVHAERVGDELDGNDAKEVSLR